MYGTVAGGDTYFTTLSFDRDKVWENSSSGDKTIALNEATTLIDKLNFVGCKHEDDQENEFPRGDDDEVPTDIIYAAYEIAVNILSGRDVEFEAENLDLNEITVAKHAVVKSRIISEAKANGIPSQKAWNKLRPYLRNPNVTFVRID